MTVEFVEDAWWVMNEGERVRPATINEVLAYAPEFQYDSPIGEMSDDNGREPAEEKEDGR